MDIPEFLPDVFFVDDRLGVASVAKSPTGEIEYLVVLWARRKMNGGSFLF
jgi:hypothetical protein